MKKTKSLLLSVCLVLSVIAQLPIQNVFAESSTTLTVGSNSGYRGDTININVKISSGSNMQACGFNLYYDSSVLEVVSAQKGNSISAAPVINTNKLGKIVYSYAATSPLNTSADLLTVQFQVKNNAPYGKSVIRIEISEISDGNFNSINCIGNSGEITVIAPTLDAPSVVEVTDYTDNTASLFWDAVENATGYNIYINDEKLNAEVIEDNCFIITDLSPNTRYSVQISTMNYLSESLKSNVVIFNTKKSIYQVMFVDWDYDPLFYENTIFGYFEIEEGETVNPPENPTREGYTFTGWDTDFSNVTSDLIVQALYEKNSCLHENTEVRNASVSTCAVQGYTGDTYCLDCGELVATGTELPLAAHHYVSTVTEPTPVAQGYTTHTCSVCGDSYVDTYTDYVGADAPQIVVSSGRAVLGNSANVTISMKNNPGIASAKLKVTYNSDVFTLTNVTDGGILGTSVHKPQMASPYTLSWVNDTATTNFTANGTIATLTFVVDENAEVGNYPITIIYSYDDYDIYNVDVEPIRFAVVNGNIEVTDVIIGDVNGDGKVNNLDRVVLTRYLADWDDYPESVIDMTAADVNCDGKVNNLDRVILTRYLADWDDYPELPYTG